MIEIKINIKMNYVLLIGMNNELIIRWEDCIYYILFLILRKRIFLELKYYEGKIKNIFKIRDIDLVLINIRNERMYIMDF